MATNRTSKKIHRKSVLVNLKEGMYLTITWGNLNEKRVVLLADGLGTLKVVEGATRLFSL